MGRVAIRAGESLRQLVMLAFLGLLPDCVVTEAAFVEPLSEHHLRRAGIVHIVAERAGHLLLRVCRLFPVLRCDLWRVTFEADRVLLGRRQLVEFDDRLSVGGDMLES